MKVALVYDRVNKWGGAERVLLALHDLFPDAELFTSVYNPLKAKWASTFTVHTSFLQRYKHVVNNHELYPFLMPSAFESFQFDGYDLVISVTSEAAKGIVTKPGTKHICYCLTPTRYLWSGYDEYFSNRSFRFLTKPVVSYLRKWDRQAASRPDRIVAISQEVKNRIAKYYMREASVIYPPVTLEDDGKKRNIIKQKNYYLIVSRLSKFTRYKRIDLAILAANALGFPLVVVGTGNWKKELEKMAGPTVSFAGDVSDTELRSYYQNAKALIYPGAEDFGLTLVEAQGFGKPVIALNKGGASETVKHKKTGFLFQEQTLQSLIEAILLFEKLTFYEEVCKKHAASFSPKVFREKFLKLVQKTI